MVHIITTGYWKVNNVTDNKKSQKQSLFFGDSASSTRFSLYRMVMLAYELPIQKILL